MSAGHAKYVLEQCTSFRNVPLILSLRVVQAFRGLHLHPGIKSTEKEKLPWNHVSPDQPHAL